MKNRQTKQCSTDFNVMILNFRIEIQLIPRSKNYLDSKISLNLQVLSKTHRDYFLKCNQIQIKCQNDYNFCSHITKF